MCVLFDKQTPQGVVLAWARDTGWRLLCAGRFLRGKRTETEHITFGESEHESSCARP
jgi:hypothetical protein